MLLVLSRNEWSAVRVGVVVGLVATQRLPEGLQRTLCSSIRTADVLMLSPERCAISDFETDLLELRCVRSPLRPLHDMGGGGGRRGRVVAGICPRRTLLLPDTCAKLRHAPPPPPPPPPAGLAENC
jgi:hypothetical protein